MIEYDDPSRAQNERGPEARYREAEAAGILNQIRARLAQADNLGRSPEEVLGEIGRLIGRMPPPQTYQKPLG